MTRFAKHLGKGAEVEIEKEKYVIKPLGTEHLPDFFKAMKSFAGMGKDSKIEDVMKNMNDECVGAIQRLIDATLEKSFPEEWKENQNEVKEFGMKYMGVLIGKIFEINSSEAGTHEAKKKKELFDKLNK